jgi:hypothetical protein
VKSYFQKQKSFALARLLCCISHHCSSSITHVTIATCRIQTFKTKYIKAQKQNFILLQYKPLKFKINTNGLFLKLSSLLVMGAIVKEHSNEGDPQKIIFLSNEEGLVIVGNTLSKLLINMMMTTPSICMVM